MSLKAECCKHTLNFKFDAGTSRGVLRERDSWFIKLFEESVPEVFGLGEASPLKGLSIDFKPELGSLINRIIDQINADELGYNELEKFIYSAPLENWPSVVFALETALKDLQNGGQRKIYPNDFYEKEAPILMNGLIWMGSEEFMAGQIEKKLEEGFSTVKMKIGAIDFETEYKLLKSMRDSFSAKDLTLRVDANGAFSPEQAPEILEKLAKLEIHSIEQPIKAGQWEDMARLCQKSPVPIALDEELIGIKPKKREELLDQIQPQFLIFKPTLLGGLKATSEWISLCDLKKINWWMTSALESNIGLNAIAQFTAETGNKLPQGLGTGQLYHNNIPSPLEVKNGQIFYSKDAEWDFSQLNFKS